MLAGGVLLMVIGFIVGFLSMGGGLTGVAFGWPIGAGLFSMGFFLAIAGAIVNAIERATSTTNAEIRATREAIQKGVDSLWQQLDLVRVNTTPVPPAPALPVTSVRAE